MAPPNHRWLATCGTTEACRQRALPVLRRARILGPVCGPGEWSCQVSFAEWMRCTQPSRGCRPAPENTPHTQMYLETRVCRSSLGSTAVAEPVSYTHLRA